MYKYLNLFSISMFFVSLCMIYANWSTKKNKKNTITLMILITIVVYQVLLTTNYFNKILLQYNSQILIMLLILNLSLYKLKNNKFKLIIGINYTLTLFPIVKAFRNDVILYDEIVILYMLITIIYMLSKCIYKNKLSISSNIILVLWMLNLTISLLIKERIDTYYTYNILNIISALIILTKVYSIYIKDVKVNMKKLYKKIEIYNEEIIKNEESLDINKNINKAIKDNLNKKKKLLNTILDQSNKCVILIDNLGYIVNEDESFFNMWREYKNFEDKISLEQFLNKSIKNKEKFLRYLSLLDKDVQKIKGEFESNDGRFFDCTYCKIVIDERDVGFICYVEDTTYKKNSEIKIKENKLKYKKIVDNIPYCVLLTEENRIVYNNNKIDNINFSDKLIKNIIFNSDLVGEFSYNDETDQKVFMNIERANFIDNKSKKNVIAIRDITQYKYLLEKLKINKLKYESLVNIIPEGIYISNLNNEIIYANSRFIEMAASDNIKDINKNIVLTSSKNHENIKFQRCHLNKGDKDIYIECGATVLDVNRKLNVVGIVRDITKQVETELIEIEIEKQKREHKIKSEFFINMSHELKTPLNVISSANQLISILYKDEINSNENSQLSKTVKSIKQNSDILMDIINNIMDLSKLELNFYENSKDYYNIVTLVEDAAVGFTKCMNLNNIELFFDTDEEERISFVDPKDIEKIVLTLVTLVLKYSNKNSRVDILITSKKNKSTISIRNRGGYDYNRYINDKDRRILDISVSLAKHLIVLYNGKIDIKTDSDKNIEITIDLKLENDIKYYKNIVKDDNETIVYQRYLNMCNF